MGYTTDFHGHFNISPEMKSEHIDYINQFSATRRMKRNAALTEQRSDAFREAVGLPVGAEGGYFVAGEGFHGQESGAADIIDYNRPPVGQPGLWCQWVVTEGGTELEWDGGEKFYSYVEWLEYLIEHFFAPWGYTLHGAVEWRGEDWDDTGFIEVEDNKVRLSA
jgi:hypothetical protein